MRFRGKRENSFPLKLKPRMNAADDDAIKTTLEWPFYAKLNIHAEVCTREGESSQFHKFRAQLVGCDGVFILDENHTTPFSQMDPD